MTRSNRSLVWLRRDLRLRDHAALAEAERLSDAIAVVFVFDRGILDKLEDVADRRMTFIHRSLRELDEALRKRGSMLVVRVGDPVDEIPLLARALQADAVFAGRDYEPTAIRRDEAVARALRASGIAFHALKDQVIYERDEILSGAGTPFRVFTPYKNAWLQRFRFDRTNGADPAAERSVRLRALLPADALAPHMHAWTLRGVGFAENALWLEPGARAAERRLRDFAPRLTAYGGMRDFPARDGTSGLSAHLRFGTVSIRALFRLALEHPSAGADVWTTELIWREFYQMILSLFPYVVDGAFKKECDAIVWPGRLEHFEAWCEGRTGYPVVDAAMRDFNVTGWMHNRLRMIVASFLTKDLLVDWRLGEAHFAARLLDFDLAANSGGWQWSASTGCDAQPYFRVFNPVLQSRKFDPDGAYIRAHCPELAGFPGSHIHAPFLASCAEQDRAGCVIGRNYPAPIVDHAEQRVKAIALFKRAGG